MEMDYMSLDEPSHMDMNKTMDMDMSMGMHTTFYSHYSI